ncbi:MAG: coenzyme F420-0:L-glutamate ligase [Candidatus Kerfeldbacteria bacterium]|nr:coenzyme F420-0:L-glutamate ligase [Candidatus Kerfeldbacteria bacterium]
MEPCVANPGKELVRVHDGVSYARLPIKTSVITKDDNIADIVERFVEPHIQDGDIVFISERVVAITQGRAYAIADIKASKLATFLSKRVFKSPYGIGLGSPWTMQLAIQEAGAARILLGALVAALTKPFGIKGMFYKVVGEGVNAIDGPCDYTLPPYNKYAVLGPKNPHKVARELAERFGHDVVIIDANDLDLNVLGVSNPAHDYAWCKGVYGDNPTGQSSEQTPICIVRRQ